MQAQQTVVFDWNQAQLGAVRKVILDHAVEGEENVWVGRSHADAPDVDAAVYVSGHQHHLSIGDIVDCEIVASQDYDLVGVVINV